MIIVAPDKFKGTLTADEAAGGIKTCMLTDREEVLLWPMADGGEGTAAALGHCLGLEKRSLHGMDALMSPRVVEYYADNNNVAYMDSASSIGLQYLIDRKAEYDPWDASSHGLGDAIAKLFDAGFSKVVVGVGGTACCDGGRGLVDVLPSIPHGCSVEFLADVDVPLLPHVTGGLSALTFMRQKGFGSADEPVMAARLRQWLDLSGGCSDWPYAGSGSGVGYGLTLIGARGCSGAEYVLAKYLKTLDVSDRISMIVTGEGRFDNQSLAGKVTGRLIDEAKRRGVPCVVVAGCVDYDGLTIPDGVRVVDLSDGLSQDRLPDKAETLKRMSAHFIG